MGSVQHIDLSERHGHRDDHGFANGAEFNVKIHQRVDIPDFVRTKLSAQEIDDLWWEEAERAKGELETELRRRYKWVGQLSFVGRGPGWLAIEDTVGGRSRNWDAIGEIVSKRLREFVTSMEDADTWRDVRGVEDPEVDGGQLVWSPGSHRGSSDVFYVAEDPSPGLKHGKYQIRRAEGGNALTYERWRDEHGGAVPIQHVKIGDRYRSLSDAKAAAEAHHAAALDRAREISTGLTEGHLGNLRGKREALETSLGRGRSPSTSKIEQDVSRVSGVVRGGRSKRR